MRFVYSLFLILLFSDAVAQRRSMFMPYGTVSFGGGSGHYFGDLTDFSKPLRTLVNTPRWSGVADYTYHFSPRFSTRTSFSYIRIIGDDFTFNTKNDGTLINQFNNPEFQKGILYRFYRNANFRNDLKEFTVQGLFNFRYDEGRNAGQRIKLMPYVFGGVGFYAHNPKTKVDYGVPDLDGKWVSPKKLIKEDPNNQHNYNTVVLTVPVGFGVRYKLSDRSNISFEGSLRWTPFDYLDDIGSEYVNPLTLNDLDGFKVAVPENMYQPITSSPVKTANLAKLLNDRSLEVTAGRKGKDRSAAYAQASGAPATISSEPKFFSPSVRQVGYNDSGTRVGTLQRFSNYTDFYATFQIKFSFILNKEVNCPN